MEHKGKFEWVNNPNWIELPYETLVGRLNTETGEYVSKVCHSPEEEKEFWSTRHFKEGV